MSRQHIVLFILFFLIFISAIIIIKVHSAPQYRTRSEQKGARGEAKVSALNQKLNRHYQALDDILMPLKNGKTTQIDHIIFSPFGIFVIETKNMSGWIFGDENAPYWTQVLPNGRQFSFQNPLHQNRKHCRVISESLHLPAVNIISVIVFIGDCSFKTPMPSNVCLGGKAYLRYIKRRKKIRIPKKYIVPMMRHINAVRLKNTEKNRRRHIQNVQSP